MSQEITTITDPGAMRRFSEEQKTAGRRVAFVPTMGALHDGHAQLIRHAAQLADIVVTSVFVNPTQFGPNEDFDRYPRNLEQDLNTAAAAGSQVMFAPSTDVMYPDGVNCSVHVKGQIVEVLEGASRPGHFDGVATIVSKLFNIVAPDIAVFGLKDYQQTLVVKALTRDLNFPIEIVLAPTVREANGLARSSRNQYLSAEDRQKAGWLYAALFSAAQLAANGEQRREMMDLVLQQHLTSAGYDIEYACALDANDLSASENFIPGQEIVLLLAVRVGTVRLIDNIVTQIQPLTVAN